MLALKVEAIEDIAASKVERHLAAEYDLQASARPFVVREETVPIVEAVGEPVAFVAPIEARKEAYRLKVPVGHPRVYGPQEHVGRFEPQVIPRAILRK